MEDQLKQLQDELVQVKANAYDKTVALERELQRLSLTLQELLRIGEVENVDKLIEKLKEG